MNNDLRKNRSVSKDANARVRRFHGVPGYLQWPDGGQGKSNAQEMAVFDLKTRMMPGVKIENSKGFAMDAEKWGFSSLWKQSLSTTSVNCITVNTSSVGKEAAGEYKVKVASITKRAVGTKTLFPWRAALYEVGPTDLSRVTVSVTSLVVCDGSSSSTIYVLTVGAGGGPYTFLSSPGAGNLSVLSTAGTGVELFRSKNDGGIRIVTTDNAQEFVALVDDTAGALRLLEGTGDTAVDVLTADAAGDIDLLKKGGTINLWKDGAGTNVLTTAGGGPFYLFQGANATATIDYYDAKDKQTPCDFVVATAVGDVAFDVADRLSTRDVKKEWLYIREDGEGKTDVLGGAYAFPNMKTLGKGSTNATFRFWYAVMVLEDGATWDAPKFKMYPLLENPAGRKKGDFIDVPDPEGIAFTDRHGKSWPLSPTFRIYMPSTGTHMAQSGGTSPDFADEP